MFDSEPKPVWQYFDREMRLGNKVMVVGPSSSILRDPSLLFAAYRLRAAGAILVCDPQSSLLQPQIHEEEGDATRHIDQIKFLRGLGLPLQIPHWTGRSTASRTGQTSASFDVIIDHDTSVSLIASQQDDPKQREAAFLEIYTEYARVLQQKGKLLLQTDLAKHGLTDGRFRRGVLTRALEQAGFSLKRHHVQDTFEIPVPEPFVDRFHARSREIFTDHYERNYAGLTIETTDNGPVLRFLQTYQNSPDLIIGVKK